MVHSSELGGVVIWRFVWFSTWTTAAEVRIVASGRPCAASALFRDAPPSFVDSACGAEVLSGGVDTYFMFFWGDKLVENELVPPKNVQHVGQV